MKKADSKSIMTGLGIAMALGSGAMLVGSAVKTKGMMNMSSMKKSAEKAIKNIGNFLEM